MRGSLRSVRFAISLIAGTANPLDGVLGRAIFLSKLIKPPAIRCRFSGILFLVRVDSLEDLKRKVPSRFLRTFRQPN